MTSAVTERKLHGPHNGRVPKLDSPAAPASAGACARPMITVTQSAGKLRATITTGARRWWAWTARPLSLRAAWALSGVVDDRRIPGRSGVLRVLWRISNHTDRIAMFALIMAAPTFLTGPLRWIAIRPTRRWASYILLAVLAALT